MTKIIIVSGKDEHRTHKKRRAAPPPARREEPSAFGFGRGMGSMWGVQGAMSSRKSMADSFSSLGQAPTYFGAPAQRQERPPARRYERPAARRYQQPVRRAAQPRAAGAGESAAMVGNGLKAIGGALRTGASVVKGGIQGIQKVREHNANVRAYEEREHEKAETGIGMARYDSRGNVIGKERPKNLF